MAQKDECLSIWYFDIRGKAQVPRLLCQYLDVPYKNKVYTPKLFIEEKKKNPKFSLPFLKQNKTEIFGPEQMCYFILARANKEEMMGKTEEDKVKIKMYCWSIDSFASVIGSNSTKKPTPAQMEKQWQKNLKSKLQKYEKACLSNGQWFLSYLSLIDFSIYELVRYMELMFPGKMKIFENLCNIKSRIGMLPEIKAYENSSNCIKQMSPETILKQIAVLMDPKGQAKKK